MGERFQMVPVPPPEIAPFNDNAAQLGLVQGLIAKRTDRMCRCDPCDRWIKPGEWLIMVPDPIRRGDPEWAIIEQCRLNTYNGSWSGWCLECAPKRGG